MRYAAVSFTTTLPGDELSFGQGCKERVGRVKPPKKTQLTLDEWIKRHQARDGGAGAGNDDPFAAFDSGEQL
jgi:hypothetical protein